MSSRAVRVTWRNPVSEKKEERGGGGKGKKEREGKGREERERKKEGIEAA